MAEWKKYERNGKTFFFNTLTKKSQWTKPPEMEEYEKTNKKEEENSVWQVRKDRFGRTSYFNKETSETTLSKPYEIWTDEEKAAKRKQDEELLRAEEERKRKEREAKRRKKGPKAIALLAEYKKIQDDNKAEAPGVAKLKASASKCLPCPGLVVGQVVEIYKKRDGTDVKDYDGRRVSLPKPSTGEGVALMKALYAATLGVAQHDPTTPKTYLSIKLLHLISIYCVDELVMFENFVTIPTNPSHPKYPKWYGKNKYVGDDMKDIGWGERCVALEPYLAKQKARQEELEKADATKEPRCSDEQWTKFWADKYKTKEEMNLLKRRKKLGF